MKNKTVFRRLFRYICLALLGVVLASCSTDSAPVAPEAEPSLQTEAVTDVAEMKRRADEWINRIDFRDPNRLAQPWGYRQDCSGYISYVWGLGTPGNSGSQPNTTLFAPGKGYGYAITVNELQFGDVLNKPRTGAEYDGHIVMFGGWVDKSAGTFWRYHVTGPAGVRGSTYGARKAVMNISTYSSAKGYTPVRSNAVKQATLPTPSGSLSSVSRYIASTGPCYGKGSSCTFDSRTFVTLNGQLIESISAYGKYWNFVGGTLKSSGYLSSVSRYNASNGPCYGKGSSCKFDSRTFVTLNGQLIESISAYGKYWNFVGNTFKSSGYLSSVSRYNASNGPCYGKGNACTFDSRTFVTLNGQLIESISAYGKYWNFVDTTLLSSGALSSVAKYTKVGGPCYGKGSSCKFDSRTFVTIGGKQIESISAYGQYWNIY